VRLPIEIVAQRPGLVVEVGDPVPCEVPSTVAGSVSWVIRMRAAEPSGDIINSIPR